VDARSDQFSYCVALCEAMVGERPFVADSLLELATKVVEGELSPRVTHARGRFGRLLRRGLSSVPDDRFASMGELLAELDRVRRGSWFWWGAGLVVVGTVGAVTLARTPDSACDDGNARVDAFWERTAAGIGGAAYTTAFIDQARERYVDAVDAYAADWVRAHTTSCSVVGQSRDEGTPEQRRAAECLDNRLASLEGLVEFVRDGSIDAATVDALVDSLPSLEECNGSPWIPYPADPESAARASDLHQRIQRLQWARYADATVGRIDEAREVERATEELGEPYLRALALRELGRLVSESGDADTAAAHFDEGLRLALENGHDRLAATLVNEIVIAAGGPDPSAESLRMVGIGLAFARRGGAEDVAGSLLLNKANLLRRLRDPDAALEALHAAADAYRRTGSDKNLWRVRVNEVMAMIDRGDVDLALKTAEQLRSEVTDDLEHALELVHTEKVLWAALNAAGRFREALEVARAALAHARAVFAPGSATLHNAAWANAGAAIRLGLVEEAEACLSLATHPTAHDPMVVASFRAWIALTGRRVQEAERILDEALQRPHRTPSTHLAEILRSELHLRAGNVEDARRILEDPRVWADAAAGVDAAIEYAITAMHVGLPAPEGKTWAEILAAYESAQVGTQWMQEAAMGMATDSVPRVSAARAMIASAATEETPELWLLDLWLALGEH
jgi:tetratricopeptide (TPR) repeat protein